MSTACTLLYELTNKHANWVGFGIVNT